jgi:hypothetical protein
VLRRARFQPPPRRTERADFQHSALLPASQQSLCDVSSRRALSILANQPVSTPHSLLPPPSSPCRISPVFRSCRLPGVFIIRPCLPTATGLRCSRAPWLPEHYSGSSLLRAHPPPSRRQPLSRFSRLYDLPCSTDFAVGRGRFLQLLGLPLSPCCP